MSKVEHIVICIFQPHFSVFVPAQDSTNVKIYVVCAKEINFWSRMPQIAQKYGRLPAKELTQGSENLMAGE